ncbi:PqqD family protein [Sphingomonas suaedae]|uniref:PqqD family protein n=1 Tax=Sphingomonas suaedae TaxID=2599297 RepID=UPI001648AC27|nr:PqqD family protein [Sphingomonas suaedae]
MQNRVVVNPAVLSTAVDGSVVLMDIESGRYFGFDPIATDIWTAIAQPCTIDSLCQDLAARYDAPIEQIRISVLAFLTDLQRKKLIEISPE